MTDIPDSPPRWINLAPFAAGVFPVSAVISWSAVADHWKIESVLVRTVDGAYSHSDWANGNAPAHWDHLAAAIIDGGGGDRVEWDVTGFETDREEAVATIVASWTSLTRERPDEVAREATGLLSPAGPGTAPAVLPAYLLRDDNGDLHVVPLDPYRIDVYRIVVGYLTSVEWCEFQTTAFPALDRYSAWKIISGFVLGIGYGDQVVEVPLGPEPPRVGGEGHAEA